TALRRLHGFLLASLAFLLAAVGLGAAAAIADVSTLDRARLVGAEVAALVAWVALGILAYAHGLVTRLVHGARRARVLTGRAGPRPPRDRRSRRAIARAPWAMPAAGFALVVGGSAVGSASTIAVGGVAIAATGAVTLVELGPAARRAVRPLHVPG